MLFLVRMKYHASLPENKYAQFLIPSNMITYGESILSVEQIDEFIKYNNLIVRPQLEEEISQEVQKPTNIGKPDEYKNSSEQKKGEVREVFFKVPKEYLEAMNNGSNSDCSTASDTDASEGDSDISDFSSTSDDFPS